LFPLNMRGLGFDGIDPRQRRDLGVQRCQELIQA
jgi:hypothetical protein